jgi:hypothetical protein
MSKNVTLTIILRGKAEDLARKYSRILKEAEKAYFISAQGRIVPADGLSRRRIEDLDRGA